MPFRNLLPEKVAFPFFFFLLVVFTMQLSLWDLLSLPLSSRPMLEVLLQQICLFLVQKAVMLCQKPHILKGDQTHVIIDISPRSESAPSSAGPTMQPTKASRREPGGSAPNEGNAPASYSEAAPYRSIHEAPSKAWPKALHG